MLAVAGGKGGCGKTTTALGLALVGDHRGLSVLAVDADVDVPDLHRVAGTGTEVAASHTPEPRPVPDAPGVQVLPARPGTDPGALDERLAEWPRAHDLVLLDCPAGAGPDAAVPLRTADRTLLVTTDAPPSLRDAAKTAAMSRAVGTPIAGAVVTGADRPPKGVDGLLGTTTVEAVPRVDAPLRCNVASRRYTRVLRQLSGI